MMGGLMVLGALALGSPVAGQVQQVARFLELDAPVNVAVGDEVLCTARIDRPGDAQPVGEVDFGVAWASEGPVERADPGGTTFTWTLVPLTAGTVELPAIEFDVEGERWLFGARPALEFVVASPRPADDEALRPLPAFREPAVDAGLGPRLLPIGLAAGLGLLIAGYGVLRLARGGRRGVPSATERPASAAERLGAIDPAGDPLAAAAALGPLLREAVDGAAEEDRSALTDDEWLAASPGQGTLSQDERSQVETLLRSSAEARYGGRAPGVFALKDDLAAARAIVRRIPSPPGQGGQQP